MTTATAQPPHADLADVTKDLLDEDKRFDPALIGAESARLEAGMSGSLVPFLGLNGFLLGALTLVELRPDLASLVAAVAASMGIGAAVWLYRGKQFSSRQLDLFSGATFALLALAILLLPIPWLIADVIIVVLALGMGGLVVKDYLGPRVVALLVIYLPLMLYYVYPEAGPKRLAIESAVFLPLFLLFHLYGQRRASFLVLVGAVLTAFLESSMGSQVFGVMTALFAIFLVFAGLYEWRIAKEAKSNSRIFIGQAPLMLLLYLFFSSLPIAQGSFAIWAWALCGAAYQLVKAWQGKLQQPTRLAWATITLFCALFLAMDEQLIRWPTFVSLVLALVAATQLAALWTKNRFIASVGAILALVAGAFVYFYSVLAFWWVTVVLGLATSGVLCLLSMQPDLPTPIPWWTGFLKQDHVRLLKGTLIVIGTGLGSIGLLATIARWVARAFRWLKYCKGGGQPFKRRDLLFVIGNIYGAAVLANQLLFLTATSYPLLHVATPALVYTIWGIGVFILGLRREQIFYRLLGTAMIVVPVAVAIKPTWFVLILGLVNADIPGDLGIAVLTMVSGIGLWVLGMLSKLHRVEASVPAQTDGNLLASSESNQPREPLPLNGTAQ